MDDFKVGDIVEVFGLIYDTRLNYLEGTIESLEKLRYPINKDGQYLAYAVKLETGELYYVSRNNLRIKKPPVEGKFTVLNKVLDLFKVTPLDAAPTKIEELEVI